MIVKAKKEYKDLPDNKNFIALGKASTHLQLLAGMECEVSKSLLPLSKELLKALENKKIKSEDK